MRNTELALVVAMNSVRRRTNWVTESGSAEPAEELVALRSVMGALRAETPFEGMPATARKDGEHLCGFVRDEVRDTTFAYNSGLTWVRVTHGNAEFCIDSEKLVEALGAACEASFHSERRAEA